MSALVLENPCETSVYAPQGRRQQTAKTVAGDTFARRERIVYIDPQYYRRPIELKFPVGSKEFKLTIDDGTSIPDWIISAVKSMNARWGDLPGWDSYDARPTDSEHAIRLLKYLSQILPDKAVAPIITPLADGGLQAEWHTGEKDIEIVVPFGEQARYYYFDAATGQEEEEELEERYIETVRNHISSL